MSLRFRVFMWMMIGGFLSGGFETLELANGWQSSTTALYIAGFIFMSGLIGTAYDWPKPRPDSE